MYEVLKWKGALFIVSVTICIFEANKGVTKGIGTGDYHMVIQGILTVLSDHETSFDWCRDENWW